MGWGRFDLSCHFSSDLLVSQLRFVNPLNGYHVTYGELPGSIAILMISAIIPIVLGFFNQERFDYNTLKQAEDISTYSTNNSVVQKVID